MIVVVWLSRDGCLVVSFSFSFLSFLLAFRPAFQGCLPLPGGGVQAASK